VPTLTPRLITIFAIACGLAVANIYYVQPLLSTIDRTFGVGAVAGSEIVTLTQLGYALGLVTIVPLADLLENRMLVVRVLGGTTVALVAVALAPNFGAFLAAAVLVGVTSVIAQILVPFAAHLAPEATRGRVVGRVMSGLLVGILLSRAIAGVVGGALGWRLVYGLAAIATAATALVLARALPRREPTYRGTYGSLVRSLVAIYRREPVLRRRAVYQALMFAAFSAFWTCVTFVLASPRFGFTETAIGLFALAGAAGALVAPQAGRLGDAGWTHPTTAIALGLAALGFLIALVPTVWALVLAAILIDAATQTTLVLGQRAIYALGAEERGRLNTLFIATFFVGGAAGSAASGIAYERFGWHGVVALGVALPLVALAWWLTERGPATSARATGSAG